MTTQSTTVSQMAFVRIRNKLELSYIKTQDAKKQEEIKFLLRRFNYDNEARA